MYIIELILLFIKVRGTLRVIMSPLVPASPLVGGLSIFFLDKPVSTKYKLNSLSYNLPYNMLHVH